MTEASPTLTRVLRHVPPAVSLDGAVAPVSTATSADLSRARWAALRTRIASLRARHATLESQIGAERKNLLPDEQRLKRFKRTKLAIKDELARLDRMLGTFRHDPGSRMA